MLAQKPLQYLILLFVCLSCKTVTIHQDQQKQAEYPVTLGSLGDDTNFVIQKDYKTVAYPKYNTPIKVEAKVVPFSKATFQAFQKANAVQSAKVSVNYVDSLSTKPRFVNISISDQLGVLNSIKSETNSDIKDYLLSKDDVHVVTHVSLALNTNDIADIQKAEELFLSASGLKSYALSLYTNSTLTKTINFKDGVLFSYKTSNFCWQQDDKYKLQIVDLIESSSRCPKKTYRSAKRANKKINYYKF